MGLSSLLEFTERGIYVPKGDFYIDPNKKVKHAVITHAHSDHAISGHQNYLCTHLSKPILKLRLGSKIKIQSLDYAESLNINGVKVSFHPAGHIPGSAQVRLEYKGNIVVISGDYKLENDGLTDPFEIIKCHEYVTESTFALPVYQWQKQDIIYKEIYDWWQYNQSQKKASIINSYPLGKSQRLIHAMHQYSSNISCHSSIEATNQSYRSIDVPIPTLIDIMDIQKRDAHKYLILTPTIISQAYWMQNFPGFEIAEASGWMATKNRRHKSSSNRQFTLSDHADWNALNTTIDATGAEKVFVTHGFCFEFSEYLKEKGIQAYNLDSILKSNKSIAD
ncbi:MAG: ligase-associated DNA damage response exonuclease [Saprospiraceae bacterium]